MRQSALLVEMWTLLPHIRECMCVYVYVFVCVREAEKTFWILLKMSSVEAQVVNVAMSELNLKIDGKTQNQDYRFCCLFKG